MMREAPVEHPNIARIRTLTCPTTRKWSGTLSRRERGSSGSGEASGDVRFAEGFRLVGEVAGRDAGAEHVLVAVHVVDARDRRPVFLLLQCGQRERGEF